MGVPERFHTNAVALKEKKKMKYEEKWYINKWDIVNAVKTRCLLKLVANKLWRKIKSLFTFHLRIRAQGRRNSGDTGASALSIFGKHSSKM